MEFEWDEAKRRSNLAKHGVDFAVSRSFDWAGAEVRLDSRRDYGEDRAVAYGRAGDGRFYVIVFTMRANAMRIISARQFGRKDHEYYGSTQSR